MAKHLSEHLDARNRLRAARTGVAAYAYLLGPAVLLTTVVLVLQWTAGAYRSDLARDPDESAHFVTGLMVYDYLSVGMPTAPLAFARDYYGHYPKVALGHWPPAFYGIQAAWYSVFGPSKQSATWLVGFIAVVIGLMIYAQVHEYYGAVVAIIQSVGFVSLPIVRDFSTLIMSDLLTVLFSFLAALAFRDFVRSTQKRHLGWFALWAGCGLLTKGTAAYLVWFPLVALTACGQLQLLRSKTICGLMFVLTICVLSMVAVGFHAFSAQDLLSPQEVARLLSRAPTVLKALVRQQGLWLFVAAMGALSLWRTGSGSRKPDRIDATLWLAWFTSAILFVFLIPFAPGRILLATVPPVMMLSARGLYLSQPRVFSKSVLCVIGGLLVLYGQFCDTGRDLCVRGYGAAADAATKSEAVVIISSDSSGEGAFVAECRLRDQRWQTVVLRASKVLSESEWSGANYKLLYPTADVVYRYLVDLPVRFVVLDDSAFHSKTELPHHQLLHVAIQENPATFALRGVYPVTDDGKLANGTIKVYENIRARGRFPHYLDLRMRLFDGPAVLHLDLRHER